MNNQPPPKAVLCRPRGGLNDTLCQIQRCFAYCRKHGRTLVLDTSRSGLRDDFFRYFDVVGTSVAVMSWHAFAKSNSVPGLTVHPAEVRERLDSYQTTLGDGGVYFDVETSVGLSFDFAKPHPETLLLHEACGGGINSIWLLKYLQPTKFLSDQLAHRLGNLPASYVAVHIRNTDLETDHKKLLWELEYVLTGRNVLYCTDSGTLQAELQNQPAKGSRPYFLTALDHTSSARLHEESTTSIDSNIDMLADLFALARSKTLYFTFTKAGYISGFSGLAYALHCSRLRKRITPVNAENDRIPVEKSVKTGAFRYLKAQAVIIIAKLAYRVMMTVHELWPSR